MIWIPTCQLTHLEESLWRIPPANVLMKQLSGIKSQIQYNWYFTLLHYNNFSIMLLFIKLIMQINRFPCLFKGKLCGDTK